jgi:hypothetical protein
MKTVDILLSIYKKPRLRFSQVCEAIGVSMSTGYKLRSLCEFPVAMIGHPLTADVRDVAEYLDALRRKSELL